MTHVPSRLSVLLAIFAVLTAPVVAQGTPTLTYQIGGSIYTSADNGSGARRVLSAAGTAARLAPVWSPDGTEIAFSGNPGGRPWGIYVMNRDGSGLRSIVSLPSYQDPMIAWSPVATPDGRVKIAYVNLASGSNRDVWVVNPDGTGNVCLLASTLVSEWHVAWSSDATRLFVADGWSTDCFVWTLGTDGGGNLAILDSINVTDVPGVPFARSTGFKGYVWYPEWARHSDRIVVSVRGYAPARWDLWVIDLDDVAHPLQLTNSSTVDEYGACWSPDDSVLYFTYVGTQTKLARMSAAGGAPTLLGNGGMLPDRCR